MDADRVSGPCKQKFPTCGQILAGVVWVRLQIMRVRALQILRWLPNEAKSYVKEDIRPKRLVLLNF